MTAATTNFGRDTSCTTTLRTGRFVTGARLIGEAAFRRLTTPRGMLRGGEEEQNYGIDLHNYCGSTRARQDAAAMPGRIAAELQKDERIESVSTTVVVSKVGAATNFDVVVEVVTRDGPFTLQIGINELTVDLVSLKAGT